MGKDVGRLAERREAGGQGVRRMSRCHWISLKAKVWSESVRENSPVFARYAVRLRTRSSRDSGSAVIALVCLLDASHRHRSQCCWFLGLRRRDPRLGTGVGRWWSEAGLRAGRVGRSWRCRIDLSGIVDEVDRDGMYTGRRHPLGRWSALVFVPHPQVADLGWRSRFREDLAIWTRRLLVGREVWRRCPCRFSESVRVL